MRFAKKKKKKPNSIGGQKWGRGGGPRPMDVRTRKKRGKGNHGKSQPYLNKKGGVSAEKEPSSSSTRKLGRFPRGEASTTPKNKTASKKISERRANV